MEFFEIFIWAVVSLIIYQSHRQRKKITWFSEKVDLSEKIALVCGGTSGIGKAAAKVLAKKNCHVIIASPNQEKGNNVVQELQRDSGGGKISVIELDLSKMSSIRKASQYLSEMIPEGLDILIHSAGLAMVNSEDTADGIEVSYQVNALGPYLLTEKLLPFLMKKSGRVIFVGSKQANKVGQLSLNAFSTDDIESYKLVSKKLTTYINSKMMASVMAASMAEDYRNRGLTVTVNVAFPGLSQTSIFRHTALASQFLWIFLGFIFSKYPIEGAQSVLYCATSAEMQGNTGKFISECKEREHLRPKILTDSTFVNAFYRQTKNLLKIS